MITMIPPSVSRKSEKTSTPSSSENVADNAFISFCRALRFMVSLTASPMPATKLHSSVRRITGRKMYAVAMIPNAPVW